MADITGILKKIQEDKYTNEQLNLLRKACEQSVRCEDCNHKLIAHPDGTYSQCLLCSCVKFIWPQSWKEWSLRVLNSAVGQALTGKK